MSNQPLGEFDRIARFFAPLAGPGGLELKDDAALVACTPGRALVITTDAMIEGVHYLSCDPPDLVAKKLLRVNLSDLAAMGARPLSYLLTTALPVARDDAWLARFAAGLGEDQQRFGVVLLGGDSVATTGPAPLSLTALGEIAAGGEVRRSGARPGDRVWVSGTIGDAALGLEVLRGLHTELPTAERTMLAARFQLPEPRTALGPRLAGLAHAMCDVSDGLLADLGHICEASGCAATVMLTSVPLSAAARRVVGADAERAARLATAGAGYELLWTAPPEAAAALMAIATELALPITEIGAIDAGAGVRLIGADGREMPVAAPGYRHF
jgi:thiamine-monophosphate kinase